MRFLAAIISTLLLVGCGSTVPATRGHSEEQAIPSGAPVEFLLTSAATDFRAHRPPFPARFRNVRLGYVMTSEGTRQYMLCGAFLPSEGNNPQWTLFGTIKTSGYEQLLGAAPFCERESAVWINGDFSSALQHRLDSTQ